MSKSKEKNVELCSLVALCKFLLYLPVSSRKKKTNCNALYRIHVQTQFAVSVIGFCEEIHH